MAIVASNWPETWGDDCFGVHLAQICGLRELGLPGYLAPSAPSVFGASYLK